jgi:multiple sugar transport system substrate-binding protein
LSTALFEKAGIAYPKTEQEFIDAAKALTSGDVYGYGAAWTKGFMYNCLERWMYDFDGDFFNWQNENSKKAVQFMYDCINTYKITPLAALGDDYDAMNQKMADGKYAMIFQWQYAAGIFKDAGVYGNGGPIEIIDMPTFANNKSLTGGWNYVLSKSSKNKEAAKKLLQYLSSPEGQAAFGIQSSQIPANSAALDNETLRENIAGLDMAMFYIQNVPLLPRPTHAKINELIDSTETAMQRYLTNEIDLDTCVRDAQSEIDRLLS